MATVIDRRYTGFAEVSIYRFAFKISSAAIPLRVLRFLFKTLGSRKNKFLTGGVNQRFSKEVEVRKMESEKCDWPVSL